MATNNLYRSLLITGFSAAVLLTSACSDINKKHQTIKQEQYQRWHMAKLGVQFQLAQQQYAVGDYDKCKATLAEARTMGEPHSGLELLAAKVDIEKGDLDSASVHLKDAVHLAPNDPEPYYLLGVVYQRWQKLEVAADYYQQAWDRKSNDARLMLAVVEMKITLGQLDDAQRILEDKLVYFEQTAAVRIALANNPDLIAVSRQAIAAGYDVNVARASRLPTLSAVGSGTYVNELGGQIGNFPSTGGQTTVGLATRIPIFQGGLPSARIRQAQAFQGQALEQVVGTERAVVQAARSAFAAYDAAQKAIQANTVAVQANELALEGNRAEQGVGTRTIIEVLNAEQELLNSQVGLVTAKRDAYVDGFQLLNAMGQAEAQDLGLDGGPLYDPLGNYRHVADNWNDWADDPRHPTIATRTVSPAELPPNPIVTPQILPGVVSTEPVVTSGVTPPQQ